MTDLLGRLPFDQYQRYAFTARVLDALRQADRPLQLLEVGAYAHRNLEKFQPRDQIIYLDNEAFTDLPTNGHFVQGDAVANPFRTGAFDIVIALDVLEHIRPDKRQDFLADSVRLARRGVIIGAPFRSQVVVEQELCLDGYFYDLHGHSYQWLREHRLTGLPDLQETCRQIESIGWTCKVWGHGNVSLWAKLMQAHLYVSAEPELLSLRGEVDELYNRELFARDWAPPVYRHFIVAVPIPQELNVVREIFETTPRVSEWDLLRLQERLNHLYTVGTSQPYKRLRETAIRHQSTVEEHLQALASQRAHSQNLETVIRGHEATIAQQQQELQRQQQELQRQQQELQRQQQELQQRQQEFFLKEEEVSQLQVQLHQKETEISHLDRTLWEMREKTQMVEAWLHKVQRSLGWQILHRFYHIRETIAAPPGTRRGKFYDLLKRRGTSYFDGRQGNRLKEEAQNQLYPTITPDPYQLWLARHELTPQRVRQLKEEVYALPYQPRVSIVMPVFNTEEVWLRKAIESVRGQIYARWELCICNDGSTAEHVSRVLAEYAEQDLRIRVATHVDNGGISVASNSAVSLATGEFVGLLDHDDELTLDALYEVVKLLNEKPELDFIYSDEDKLTTNGRRGEPFFKPDWSPDLLLSMNYITHFAVVRRALLQEVGGFTEGLEGSQDYDLFLRLSEATQRIAHIPKPLYSWRQLPHSTALTHRAKPYAHIAGQRALQEHLQRRGLTGDVTAGIVGPFRYRVQYEIIGNPLISIVIPIRDRVELLKRCLESIEKKTAYRHFEIIIIDNQSEEVETLTYLAQLPHTVIPQPGLFNYSQLNNVGAAHARGEFLLFLNNDIDVITDEWLGAMLEHAQRPNVGAVGAKLLYPNQTIQHAGVVLGHRGVAGHAFWYLPEDSHCYFGLLHVVRNYSAVTGACMMMRKAVFTEVGGFDERIKVAFNDVDLCLRIREQGYVLVYTPYAVLYHLESATRKHLHPPDDEGYFRQRWGKVIAAGDPYYNPHLSLERFDFSLRILDENV